MDTLSKQKRSLNMAKIPSKNTRIELKIRKLIYSMGYRYRLNDKELPGKPDLVFRTRKKVIFVHGCFWHRHKNCKLSTKPKSNSSFWESKFEKNIQRDKQVCDQLIKLGWQCLIIWECMINKNSKKMTKYISNYLDNG